MSSAIEILKKYWGYDGFRPMQDDIIASVLNGKDTLALMPTGGGKSICFQVPALAKKGICIVISPLIALMQDQVENLKNRGIKAAALHSGMSPREIDFCLDNVVYGDVKLLYVSPERIQARLFRDRVQKMNVNLIAVDEAHCISQWGYDFRPPYLKIAELRELHPNVPVLALTATATPDVVDDIQEKLAFKKKHVLQKSFVRDNLAYLAFLEENKRGRLLNICKKQRGSGVVYVRNRKKTAEIAGFLNRHGVKANHYHAGLSSEQRTLRQKEWMNNHVQVVVATNAFGMGIDKPDVRFVVHLDLPEDLESYFQEAGRGGRDEKKAFAVLLFDQGDKLDLQEKVTRKFPGRETVVRCYRSLLNHLQLAAGSGQHATFPVDLPAISKTFGISLLDLFHSLKLLEGEGYLSFNEAFYSPSTVHVVVNKQVLYDFRLRNSALAPTIELLLRSHSGLFDGPVKISEQELAKRSGSSFQKIKKQLEQLHEMEIIAYQPARNTPLVTFTQPAQYDRDLRLSKEYYELRKEVAYTKMEAMLAYLEPDVCRQRKLLNYFGEKSGKPCGQCDVCLSEKASSGSEQEIKEHILAKLKQTPMRPDEIANAMLIYDREKVLKCLTWLVDEERIKYLPDRKLVASGSYREENKV